jgi:hypothetical protein
MPEPEPAGEMTFSVNEQAKASTRLNPVYCSSFTNQFSSNCCSKHTGSPREPGFEAIQVQKAGLPFFLV